MSPLNAKNWKVVIDTQQTGNTKVSYKGEPVGLIKGLGFGLQAGSVLPTVTFEVFMSNVEIETMPLTNANVVAVNESKADGQTE